MHVGELLVAPDTLVAFLMFPEVGVYLAESTAIGFSVSEIAASYYNGASAASFDQYGLGLPQQPI